MLTALAAQGFTRLAGTLRGARADGGSFLDVGVAYVDFAVANPAHFQVMFAPTLLDAGDPELAVARAETFAELRTGVDAMAAPDRIEDAAAAMVAGWSLVHGLATLALTGNLDGAGVRDLIAAAEPHDLARRAAGMLYGSPGTPGGPR
ncbi:TetR-like C-terminal domain-containing protein [Occultella gossypii]|uniref:WHG domain-containing protein n=1 Tax=Occultella gossypii TaxID=2800820 RepID=A0ABS7SGH9_9MICO|nr:TetR-like C-terminal domain-containing protein [Occultella gossypii]MBZ2199312.1 WHG domain-containing protein [Occultella gossypii]